MNWLRGFRRLGWVLVALSAVPIWWISSAQATYTVTVEGEFTPGTTDARPPLARLREKEAARKQRIKSIIDSLPAPVERKAELSDLAVSGNTDGITEKLKPIGVSSKIKAGLWDLTAEYEKSKVYLDDNGNQIIDPPLPEQRRQQLDGIVAKMEAAGAGPINPSCSQRFQKQVRRHRSIERPGVAGGSEAQISRILRRT